MFIVNSLYYFQMLGNNLEGNSNKPNDMEYFMTTRLLNGFSFKEWEQKIEKLPIDSNLLVFYWLTIGTLGTKESGPSRFT